MELKDYSLQELQDEIERREEKSISIKCLIEPSVRKEYRTVVGERADGTIGAVDEMCDVYKERLFDNKVQAYGYIVSKIEDFLKTKVAQESGLVSLDYTNYTCNKTTSPSVYKHCYDLWFEATFIEDGITSEGRLRVAELNKPINV